MRSVLRVLLLAVPAGVGLRAIIATEGALRIPERPQPHPQLADGVARTTGASWKPVRVRAADGVMLAGWLFVPKAPNGGGVILLHGVADTREGMLMHAEWLLRSGFTVLLPDLRGHGESGGALTTYGLREAEDVRHWSDRLLAEPGVDRLYGLGESLGAAILLQSLRDEPRFRAVVAECPFATFEEVARDRIAQFSGIWRPATWPVVHAGFLYARLRYRLDLSQASPAVAVRTTSVPVLLIHGTADTNILLRHSRELRALNPDHVRLWEVPGARHVNALAVEPDEFGRQVRGCFH